MSDDLTLVKNHKLNMYFFLAMALVLLVIAFVSTEPTLLFEGLRQIYSIPCQLFTDFVAVGGFGATLVNVALVMLFELGIIHFSKATITGPSLAALLTTAGFAFFGTSLFNMIPIVLGVMAYSRIEKIPLRTLLLQAFMGSAIGPLVNFIAYGIGLDLSTSLPLAMLIGFLVGLIIPALSSSFLRFHNGYNLYNIGFTCGIIGLVLVAIFQLNGIDVEPLSILDTEHRTQLILLVLAISLGLLLFGLILNKGNLREYPKLLESSGRLLSDYVVTFGSGLTLINMGIMGLLSLAFVLLLRGPVNGPIVGAMLTIAGFGALGKHPRNCLSVMLGSTIACYFHKDFTSSSAIVTILFGTTLAPIAGRYGVFAGLIAGYLHIAVVGHILPLHGGINLYNNGFSGGFVAAVMVPLIEVGRNVIERSKKDVQTRISENEQHR